MAVGCFVVEVRVWFAWWLEPWLAGVTWFALLTGGTPDPDKVAAACRRALRVQVVR